MPAAVHPAEDAAGAGAAAAAGEGDGLAGIPAELEERVLVPAPPVPDLEIASGEHESAEVS